MSFSTINTVNNKVLEVDDKVLKSEFQLSQIPDIQLWYDTTRQGTVLFDITGQTQFVNTICELISNADATQTLGHFRPILSGNTVLFGQTNNDGFLNHFQITKSDLEPYTLTCFLKWTAGDATAEQVNPFGNSSTPSNSLYFKVAGVFDFRYRAGADIQIVSGIDTTTLYDGNWHTFTMTINDARLCSVYIDGILNGSDTLPISSFIQYNSFGKGFNGTRFYWEGGMNSYSLFSRELTFSEIRALHTYNINNTPTFDE